MKPCLSKSSSILFTLLLALSLCAACKSNANNSNSNTTTTTTNSTSVNKSTTPPVNTNPGTSTATPTPGGSSSSELHTPPDGSAERKAILESIRAQQQRESSLMIAKFTVESLKVHNGWAYIVTDTESADGEPYGMLEALLQEQGGQWKVSEVFDAPGGGVKEEMDARAKFRAKYPSAPDDIFPPMK